MKFCYCDETGVGDEPIAVMAGIIVDSSRMHLTKVEWQVLLDQLSEIVGRRVSEIHTRNFYSGNGIWRGIRGDQRAQIITRVLEWIGERKHHIVLSGIRKDVFYKQVCDNAIPNEIRTLWLALGFHIILSVQKGFQGLEGVKGNTLFVFDNEHREEKRFTDLILTAPNWSETYYNKQATQFPLDQVIDVPYFGDSKEVSLLQVADFIAFFVRRYIEISEHLDKVRYDGEDARLQDWADLISARCIGTNNTYLRRARCACADIFWNLAPKSIRSF
jgi:hypothetical protein